VPPLKSWSVAARSDERPDAQWSVFSCAHWLRRKRASDAQSLRHSARSVRRTRNRWPVISRDLIHLPPDAGPSRGRPFCCLNVCLIRHHRVTPGDYVDHAGCGFPTGSETSDGQARLPGTGAPVGRFGRSAVADIGCELNARSAASRGAALLLCHARVNFRPSGGQLYAHHPEQSRLRFRPRALTCPASDRRALAGRACLASGAGNDRDGRETAATGRVQTIDS
jgi:hypothetical protein